jgi:hypothetical protein
MIWDKFNAFSFKRGTHFRNYTLFLRLLLLFFSFTYFRLLLYIPLSFSSSFLFFFSISPLSGCHTSLSFFPLFIPLAFHFVSVSLNAFCPLSLQFTFPAPPVFTSLSVHHIASKTKCAWLLRSPLLPCGHVLGSTIWTALPATNCLCLFQQFENIFRPNQQLLKKIRPVEGCASVISIYSFFSNR